MTITILLADDHHVVRQGLRSLLALERDFQVIAEASDGLEAVRTIDRLRPQVSIVDLMMPGLGGLEVTRQVCQWTRVVILSMHDNEAYVIEALRNGAYFPWDYQPLQKASERYMRNHMDLNVLEESKRYPRGE